MSPTFRIVTLGCRANQADSARLEAFLEGAGLERAGPDESPDLLLVNTCTVTGTADRQSRQALYRGLRSGARRVYAVGCWARLDRDETAMPGGIRVLPTDDPEEAARLVIEDLGLEVRRLEPAGVRLSGLRPPLKIQTGCDESCAYCVVRLARGPSRSVPPDTVRQQARQLAEAGAAEIVLCGVNLGSWGRDLEGSWDLVRLLDLLAEDPSLPRLRLSSIEPMFVTGELLRLVGGSDGRICPHLHLPLQAGSDRVLRLMGRPYDTTGYRRIVESALEFVPDLCIGADVVTGLPGEGVAEFEETRRYVESLPLAYLHVFPYSPRPGTEAAALDAVPVGVAKERARVLRELGAAKRAAFHRAQVGSVREVVVERVVSGRVVGTAENYVTVALEDRVAPGSLVQARILAVGPDGLVGEVAHEAPGGRDGR